MVDTIALSDLVMPYILKFSGITKVHTLKKYGAVTHIISLRRGNPHI